VRSPDRGTRRTFLMSTAGTVAAAQLGAGVAPAGSVRSLGPNDRVRIATVGMGIIGFIDTTCALKVPGVELVAVSDLYEGRRAHSKEVYGARVDAQVDYRDILARKDVDAVLLCVPDHWHARMSIDAMKAGKAVYCEKPMIRTVEEGPEVIRVQKETGTVFQVGSQFASSVVFEKLKDVLASGAIGKLHAVEARYNRNSALGAWQYSIPTDAAPETVDWDRFLGSAPKRPFDADRFFRWRKYWDYGTAVAGDLFVHLLTAIHVATGSVGPTRIAAMGGKRYWDDGREVYDLIMGLLDYPETAAHPAFTLSLQTDFEDGSGENSLFRFVGSDGVIDVTFEGFKVSQVGIARTSSADILKGYNSVTTFSQAQQAAFAAKLATEAPPPVRQAGIAKPSGFSAPNNYDARYDHFSRFFASIREAKPVQEDAAFGYRAAAPALLCNDSYRQGKMIGWDPVAMRVTQ
jgi:predicted dehydrogenase